MLLSGGWCSASRRILCCALLLWLVTLHAQTTYVRDANGRVVAVTQSSGTSTQYSYDALGRVGQISPPLSAGQLAIFALLPSHGVSGTEVTIYGQGFSSTLASDSVSFNGAVATVLSATATQLVTSVPVGASTGPISVTVGGVTANSATPFMIDDTGEPPTISGVSPSVLVVGGKVTVTGTHLDPVPGNTLVQMGGSNVQLSSVSDTQLQFSVSADTPSGYVTVQTPYGQATSVNYELPSGFNAANVVSSTYATIGGAPITLNFSGPGQIGIIGFKGNFHDWLSLQLKGIATVGGTIDYTIYGPGNAVIQSGAISSTSVPSIHLPELTANGDYLVAFQSTAASTTFTVALAADAVLTTASPLAVATTIPTQSERFVFTPNAGDNLEFTLSNVSTVGGNTNAVEVLIYSPAGTLIENYYCTDSSGPSCDESLWNLTAGTYSVIVLSYTGATMSFNAVLQPDVMGPTLTANTPATVNLAAGQVERLTFNATVGQTVALDLSGVITTPAGHAVYVGIWSPSAGAITTSNTYTSLNASGQATLNLPNLPAGGTYTVIVSTGTGLPANAHLTLVPGVAGAITSNGVSQNYATSAPTQNAYLTFNANAGDNLELTLSNVSTVGGNTSAVEVQIYNSVGTLMENYYCTDSSGPSCDESLWNLTAGTYSVIVLSYTGATMSFNALLQPDVIGPTLAANTPVTVNLAAGQVEWLTFNATAGQTVALDLSGVSTTPVGHTVYVGIWSPSAGTITTGNSYTYFKASGSTTLSLPNLPVSGIYTVIVSTGTGLPATAQFTLVPQ